LNVHHIESRKNGGNAPNNLITLCKTCHDLYHDGKVELDVKRGQSFRDAASASVIKNKIFEQMKHEFHNVHMTYGYITKSRRIENNIEKSHHSDAYCIAGNLKAECLESCMIIKLLPRHTRALHVCKPNKGGKRRSAVAPHLIGKTSLQRFDAIKWNDLNCFIFGSSG
jgi:N6-L-threonylcarbamoyladenine synthase